MRTIENSVGTLADSEEILFLTKESVSAAIIDGEAAYIFKISLYRF